MSFHDRGFVALMSAVLISAILLVLIVTLNASSFFNRFNVLDSENKRVSLGLAEACVTIGLLDLGQGTFVSSPGTQVTVTGGVGQTCKLCEVTAAGSIKTRAVYNGAYTNLEITVDPNASPMTILTWSEKTTTSLPSCTVP